VPNPAKVAFIDELKRRFGEVRKLEKSESLYEVAEGRARLYFRYSKRHPRNRTFFGLRKVDLQALEGHEGILCFFWEGQREPLFVPYEEFEDIFAALNPASDGQYKAQVYEQTDGTELYIANAGRFNVESYLGWSYLDSIMSPSATVLPELNHVQIQTLLGGIGAAKGFEIWIPSNDRAKLDWGLTRPFRISNNIPSPLQPVREIAEEIDVIWMARGGDRPNALYEVEHSTPIYSGLLRFNDVYLVLPDLPIRYGIVSNDSRRSLFVRQLARPTFKASGLREYCTFLEYRNVFGWHQRLRQGSEQDE
jgi:hypothetical protein